MKRKRFSIEQIVAVLKQADLGLPVADLIRQIGISEQRTAAGLVDNSQPHAAAPSNARD